VGRILLSVALLWPAVARADRPTLGLSLRTAPELRSSCPDRSELESKLGARLGYVPVASSTGAQAVVDLIATPAGIEGRLTLLFPGAEPILSKVEGATQECGAVLDAIALSLALALDPLGSGIREPPPPPPPRPTPPPPAARAPPATWPTRRPAPPPPRPAPLPPPLEGFLFGGAITPFFALPAEPAPAIGLVAGGGLVLHGAWSLRAEVAGLFSQSRQEAGGVIEASAIEGRLTGCAVAGWVHFCGALMGGMLSASGGSFASNREDQGPIAALGPRIGLDLPIAGPIGLAAWIQLWAFLARAELALDREVLWTMSPVQIELALAPLVRW
jgi:hypothetical protein